MAQLARAPRLGRGGRWFESSYPDQFRHFENFTQKFIFFVPSKGEIPRNFPFAYFLYIFEIGITLEKYECK